MMAAENGNKEIFKVLLENGANPNLKDNRGKNAQWYAKMNAP